MSHQMRVRMPWTRTFRDRRAAMFQKRWVGAPQTRPFCDMLAAVSQKGRGLAGTA